MNHRSKSRRFGRFSAHRKSMFINLAVSLITHRQITTTLAKAKELRGFIEPLITKSGNITADNAVATRRYLIARLGSNKDAIQALIKELGPYYASRPGGYLRVLKAGYREGDCAPMAVVQLVGLSPAEMQEAS